MKGRTVALEQFGTARVTPMPGSDDVLLLGGETIRGLLHGHRADVVNVVREAYGTHGRGDTSLPHSIFLRFENNPSSRIIGLPAFLGGQAQVAGMKWVASFPANIQHGLDRASAAVILNDSSTGRPTAFLEASSINAHRTSASAALAAKMFDPEGQPETLAIVGCGYIGFEALNYVVHEFPCIKRVTLLDMQASRANYFAERVKAVHASIEIVVAGETETLKDHPSQIIALTTSAGTPWLTDRDALPPGCTVLNISLRDLTPELILSCHNVVDDTDHVCRERTSIHLAAEHAGNRDFIDAQICDLISAGQRFERSGDTPIIFSPFGLGILDLAVGQWLVQRARQTGAGETFGGFYPAPWQPATTEG